jgi:hypothetical protein
MTTARTITDPLPKTNTGADYDSALHSPERSARFPVRFDWNSIGRSDDEGTDHGITSTGRQ